MKTVLDVSLMYVLRTAFSDFSSHLTTVALQKTDSLEQLSLQSVIEQAWRPQEEEAPMSDYSNNVMNANLDQKQGRILVAT